MARQAGRMMLDDSACYNYITKKKNCDDDENGGDDDEIQIFPAKKATNAHDSVRHVLAPKRAVSFYYCELGVNSLLFCLLG